jgi:hypothetical protein
MSRWEQFGVACIVPGVNYAIVCEAWWISNSRFARNRHHCLENGNDRSQPMPGQGRADRTEL